MPFHCTYDDNQSAKGRCPHNSDHLSELLPAEKYVSPDVTNVTSQAVQHADVQMLQQVYVLAININWLSFVEWVTNGMSPVSQ